MLPTPTPEYITSRIAEFDGDKRNYSAEGAVELVFTQWPSNIDYHQILVKTVVLNRLYSTNIYDLYTVAQHILDLVIDERLCAGDPGLVDDVAHVLFKDRTRVLYSFATKYCAWHCRDHFQIYDRNVDWLLWEYRRQFDFARFKREELRQYRQFHRIVEQWKDHFNLHAFSRKQIDKFLWIEGKKQQQVLAEEAGTAGES